MPDVLARLAAVAALLVATDVLGHRLAAAATDANQCFYGLLFGAVAAGLAVTVASTVLSVAGLARRSARRRVVVGRR